MPRRPHLCAMLCVGLLSLPPMAIADADGPDAWRVTGVAREDVLNIRMGPGTEYPVIGALPPDARHLRAKTCTPLATVAQYDTLSADERTALPARWCLVDGGSQGRGWVPQAYLAEDSTASSPFRTASGEEAPPPFDIAVPLVRNLFRKETFLLSRGESLLRDPEASRSWFFLDLARKMASDPGAHPLFDAQDTDIGDISVALDPDEPIRQGVVTVLVRYTNFGISREARAYLRADPEQGGALRIFRIVHGQS
ncbi:SH3 domain-containing protein [Tranquillimonas alkanivorans]|uniref:SH3 domain-containing protein n=1 Tax=Tranquillimonas alkanivorans TaxID=441119 RepID=A0A1I5UNX2_9RHOB|nr:SH3 domain-containing protein [Tranquillimonas alkanivorans]SFP96306.1 hypothetical protein SAMN04488047_1223 [Tranquillimonas alkanivorans]